jgi:hypothetical protein
MATISQVGGIPGISNGGILQPKFKNRWKLTFSKIGAEGQSSQPLAMQVVKTERPKLSFKEVELHRYNSRAYVASKHEFQPCNVTIEDDLAGNASKIINDQISKQQFLIGAEGPFLAASPEGSLYKFAAKLEMLDGQEQTIETWVMQGCFIQNVDYTDLDYADGDAALINLVIRFDHVYQELGGYNAGPGISTGGQGN